MKKNTPILMVLIILILSGSLFASDPFIVDKTRLDYQYYWYTGSFGPQIVVDENDKVHVCYLKTFITVSDTGWTCMYANVTDGIHLEVPLQESVDINPGHIFMDGGHSTPIYLFYGVGSRFYGYGPSMHQPAMAKLSENGTTLEPLRILDRDNL